MEEGGIREVPGALGHAYEGKDYDGNSVKASVNYSDVLILATLIRWEALSLCRGSDCGSPGHSWELPLTVW